MLYFLRKASLIELMSCCKRRYKQRSLYFGVLNTTILSLYHWGTLLNTMELAHLQLPRVSEAGFGRLYRTTQTRCCCGRAP